MNNINVFIRDLPYSVHGITKQNSDGSYTIFINAHDSVNIQRQSYEHEMQHIKNNDFEKYDIESLEILYIA